MTPEGMDLLETLFSEAAALPAEDRAAFLDDTCGTDPGLRAELESLLEVADEAPSFFDSLAGAVLPSSDWYDDVVSSASAASAEPDPRIGSTVRQYQIEEELGSGSMGVVYRALDTRLKRSVALKFLPSYVGANEVAVERFRVEARAAAALDHPNVCTVYEIGEDEEDRPFIAMAYYAGETLREKLADGPLPVEEALDYARQIDAGLAAAHSHDILHRDIKPSNVIVTPDGSVKVLDFGLAKLSDAALTAPGVALGTLAYMSPQQLRGDAVDYRTDLWSLGVLLFEMLTGTRPFEGEDKKTVAHAIANTEPEAPSALRPEVPPELDALVLRMLVKDPDRRAGMDLATEPLGSVPARGTKGRSSVAAGTRRRVGFAAAAAFAVIGIVAVVIVRTGGVVADAALERAIPSASIAVLPFVNLSSEPEPDYFSEGLAEEILNALAQIEDLHVTSRSSAFSFKGQAIEIPEVATRLGVAHVLEGSVQRVGSRVRITAQLIEAATDRHLWSERFDRELELSDVFAVQDEISAAIVEALKSAMGLESAPPIRESQVVSEEAYDLYLRGLQAFGGGTTAAYRSARSYFGQAIALEPAYAVAHARLSRALLELGGEQVPSGLVREAADEAIRLDPTIGLPYTVLSMLEGREGRGSQGLTLELRAKAYELAPGDPWVTRQYGRALEARGRMSESVPLMRKAVDLAPLDPEQRSVFGMFLTLRGRPTEGLREIERAIEIDPSNRRSWRTKGDASRAVGDLVSSIEASRMAHEVDPEFAGGASRIASNYLYLGDLEASRTWMDEAMSRGAPRSIPFEAQYLLLNGQGEDALELALREFAARGAPHIDRTLMEIVVADMIARGALDEAEQFLFRYEDRLADFIAGPVRSAVGFAGLGVSGAYAIALQDVYRRAGRTAEAEALADRLDSSSMQGALRTTQLAWTGRDYRIDAQWHMRGGRPMEALSALERAVELGFRRDWQFRIRDYFVFEELREEPRFRALIETIEADMARQREILAERMPALEEELATRRARASTEI